MSLSKVDPKKLDLKYDIRYLSREIVFTLKVLDDDTFKELAPEVAQIVKEIKDELKKASTKP